jgi:hypothetical protein
MPANDDISLIYSQIALFVLFFKKTIKFVKKICANKNKFVSCSHNRTFILNYNQNKMNKLRGKAYGSIPHLLDSKLGAGDHHCPSGQHTIATIKTRDKRDTVIVQEKKDGGNTCVAKYDGKLRYLVRKGWEISSSPYLAHQLFQKWAEKHYDQFNALLDDGDRVVGEWLIQAHGLRYDIQSQDDLFVAFDYFKGKKRLTYNVFMDKVAPLGFTTANTLHIGSSISTSDAMILANANHNVIGDTPEGLVYRIERDGRVDFLVKYVRPDFKPGLFFSEVTGGSDVWNYDITLI